MKSSYDSAEHQRIRETRQALRAHAIDQNNTGTPARIIDILQSHGCSDPEDFVSRLLTHDATAGDRRLIRKIPLNMIPSVPQPQKVEEPKRRVRHTPPKSFYEPDISWNRIARGARPGDSGWGNRSADMHYFDKDGGEKWLKKEGEKEVIPTGHILVDPETLEETIDKGKGIVMTPEELKQLRALDEFGGVEITKLWNDARRLSFRFSFANRGGSMGFYEEPRAGIKYFVDSVRQHEGLGEDFAEETDTVMVNLDTKYRVREGGETMSRTTWNKIQRIKRKGFFQIRKNQPHNNPAFSEKDSTIIPFGLIFGDHDDIDYFKEVEGNTLEEVVERLTTILVNDKILTPEKTESQKPSTVRIHLSTLTVCDSKNPDEGVEVSSETLRRIKELKTYGNLIVTVHQENQFRFRFMPSAVGGPHTSYGYTLDEAMEKLWKYLNEKQVETPSDTVVIDLKTLSVSEHGKRIAQSTFEKIKKLKTVGAIVLDPLAGGWWKIVFYPDEGAHLSVEQPTIESAIDNLYGEFDFFETPADTVKIDIDDVAECTGSGPGVVSIHPKTWEDINTLKKIGRFEIFAEEKEGLFTINFYDSLQYATITDAQGSIEEVVARILQNAQNCGYYEHIVGNKYGYKGSDILDD